jgi:hypothetical protein
MSHHVRRGTAVAAASLILTLTAALPAYADTRTFHDRAGETGTSADITEVKVANGSGGGHRVAVRAEVGKLEVEDFFTFWFDTRPSNAGPEYKFVVYPNSGLTHLRRIEEFGEMGTAVRCDGLRAAADAFGPDVVSVSVPRSCLHYPDEVRVSLRGRYVDDGHQVTDWAPAERQFFGWVNR